MSDLKAQKVGQGAWLLTRTSLCAIAVYRKLSSGPPWWISLIYLLAILRQAILPAVRIEIWPLLLLSGKIHRRVQIGGCMVQGFCKDIESSTNFINLYFLSPCKAQTQKYGCFVNQERLGGWKYEKRLYKWWTLVPIWAGGHRARQLQKPSKGNKTNCFSSYRCTNQPTQLLNRSDERASRCLTRILIRTILF